MTSKPQFNYKKYGLHPPKKVCGEVFIEKFTGEERVCNCFKGHKGGHGVFP